MSKDVRLNKIIRERQQSRDIVKEIVDFQVTESQKLDIIYYLSLTLENNLAMKSIADTLKEFRESVNDENENKTEKRKILT